MGLLRKITIGAIDMCMDAVGVQMKSIEGRAKDTGKHLNSDFYDRKDSYNKMKSNYEARKKFYDEDDED